MTPTERAAVAAAYDALPTASPEARAAYAAFVDEIEAQFRNLPVDVEFTTEDPYGSSAALFSDIETRGAFRVFTGGEPHPYMSPEQNARFRAVHDYVGHFVPRASFSFDGEMRAFEAHKATLSPLAQQALATETVGQACVFFTRRAFAPQKAALLPAGVLRGLGVIS